MNTVFIYALNDPDTGQARYIGKTKNPKSRLSSHVSSHSERCHRTYWIQSLKAKGLRPVLEILDEVPEEFWPQWEVAWIAFYRELGFDLVNANAGGEGGNSPTEETRKKMSESMKGKQNALGKKYSEVARKNMSAARRGNKNSAGRKDMLGNKNCLGYKQTEEHKEKIRKARTGWKCTEAALQNMSLAHLGKKLSEAQKKKMSEAQTLRWAKHRAEKETGNPS